MVLHCVSIICRDGSPREAEDATPSASPEASSRSRSEQPASFPQKSSRRARGLGLKAWGGLLIFMELEFHDCNKEETPLFTIYPKYGSLIYDP